MRTLIAFLLLLQVVALPGQARDLVQTVAAGEMLAALPSVPLSWALLESRAESTASVHGYPMTVAIRRYQLPPREGETGVNAPGEPPPRRLVRIIVIDQGSGASGNAVQSLVSGEAKPRKGEKLLEISEIRGALREYPKRTIFEGVGAKRLSVQIEGRHFEANEFEQEIKQLDLVSLQALEERFPTEVIPERQEEHRENHQKLAVRVYEIKNERIDEINPQTNRTWVSSIVGR